MVCTHFLAAQLFTALRRISGSRTLRTQLPIATVLTDLDLQYMCA